MNTNSLSSKTRRETQNMAVKEMKCVKWERDKAQV